MQDFNNSAVRRFFFIIKLEFRGTPIRLVFPFAFFCWKLRTEIDKVCLEIKEALCRGELCGLNQEQGVRIIGTKKTSSFWLPQFQIKSNFHSLLATKGEIVWRGER